MVHMYIYIYMYVYIYISWKKIVKTILIFFSPPFRPSSKKTVTKPYRFLFESGILRRQQKMTEENLPNAISIFDKFGVHFRRNCMFSNSLGVHTCRNGVFHVACGIPHCQNTMFTLLLASQITGIGCILILLASQIVETACLKMLLAFQTLKI